MKLRRIYFLTHRHTLEYVIQNDIPWYLHRYVTYVYVYTHTDIEYTICSM